MDLSFLICKMGEGCFQVVRDRAISVWVRLEPGTGVPIFFLRAHGSVPRPLGKQMGWICCHDFMALGMSLIFLKLSWWVPGGFWPRSINCMTD